MSLMPLGEALEQVLARARPPVETLELPILEALAHTLAETVVSPIAVPGDDNSAMDGYALRAAEAGQALKVSQRIAAGAVGQALLPGTAARIFTGAVIPPGADAVVMQENCVVEGDRLSISGGVSVGENVRPRGQDIAEGAEVLPAGGRAAIR